jgi:Diacylglycerol kinase catalytic domain
VRLPVAEPPRRAVLFINPWSGGGKAAKVGLAQEAAKRGIRTVELHRGEDLVQLVHDAVAAGADALAAAGGDGTQAADPRTQPQSSQRRRQQDQNAETADA